MKNPIVIFAIIAVVAVVGLGATLTQSDSLMKKDEKPTDAMMKKDEVMIAKEDEGMEKGDDAMMKKDQTTMQNDTMNKGYIQFSKAAFDEAAGNRRVLFFYASWCPTCISADTSFMQNASQLPEDVTVIRVNYNDPETDEEEKDLARKYGITYQHTFVQIDGTGKEVTKWNGGQIDELVSNIK